MENNNYNEVEGAVNVQVFPPGPIPTSRNFGWIENDNDLEWYLLFGQGFPKKYKLDKGDDTW